MTLALDLPRVMAIALGLGAGGIPLAFWLSRAQSLRLVEKLMLGLSLGWTLIPLLFLLETISGLLYDPKLIPLHWALLFGAGTALWLREALASKEGFSGLFKLPALDMAGLEAALPGLALAVLIAVSVWIPLSAAGGLISEVDPYYYLDGVQQIVTRGSNYLNDGTAWFPLIKTDHIGQPLFKFLLAPFYSLYAPGAAYSPYVLQSVGSIYPPLMMGAAVFFVYFLFRELYHPRAGLLVGGVVAFMPVMLNEMQAGKSQITPYNIFALFFFLAMFYAMVNRRNWRFTALAVLAYAALILGSNLETLLLFCLSLFLGLMGLVQLMRPASEPAGSKRHAPAPSGPSGPASWPARIWSFLRSPDLPAHAKLNRCLAVFFVGMLAVQIVFSIYQHRPLGLQLLKDLIKSVALPAAAWGLPLLFGLLIGRLKYAGAAKGQTSLPLAAGALMVSIALFHLLGTLAALPLIALLMFFTPFSKWVGAQKSPGHVELCFLLLGALVLLATMAPDLPVASEMFDSYRFFGSYSQALTRTISEQGSGATQFDGSLGAASLTLGPAPSSGQLLEVVSATAGQLVSNAFSLRLFDMALALLSLANLIPTLLLNLFYNAVAMFMNVYLEKDGVPADFLVTDSVNSLATLFLFFGPALLGLALARALKQGGELPTRALLLLSFILPVTFMGFMKVKLLIFLAVAFVFSLGAAWAEGERLFMEFMARRAAQKGGSQADWFASWPAHPRHIAWLLVFLAVLAQLGWPTYLLVDSNPSLSYGYIQAYAMGAAILAHSGTPTFEQNPSAGFAALETACALSKPPAVCQALQDRNATLENPLLFYHPDLCYFSLHPNSSVRTKQSEQIAIGYRCMFYSPAWLSMYEWMNASINHSERITSWWDYGHWTNFFGRTNTVLRPEHQSLEMIGRVAYAYTHQDAATLRQVMKDYGSRYALMDSEIVGGFSSSGFEFGGKFSALNYLGCDWANRTGVENPPGISACELENQPEELVIPLKQSEIRPCTISQSTQAQGQIAYRMVFSTGSSGPMRTLQPVYCVRPEQAGGQTMLGVYFLDRKDSGDNLAPSPATWIQQPSQDSNYAIFAALYDRGPWTNPDGSVGSRWDYRVGPYYDSSLYSGFFLKELDGFDLVYDSQTIRIFKMKDAYWNNQSS